MPIVVVLHKWSDSQTDHRHELDEDVQRGAASVLEGVADSVANNARLALVLLLDPELFAELLRVVPGPTSVAHHDSVHAPRRNCACENAHEAPRPDRESDHERDQDR